VGTNGMEEVFMGIERQDVFNGNIDDFFEESNDKQSKKKRLLCPHCGRNIRTIRRRR
jgi:hypothetical protein